MAEIWTPSHAIRGRGDPVAVGPGQGTEKFKAARRFVGDHIETHNATQSNAIQVTTKHTDTHTHTCFDHGLRFEGPAV